MGGGGFAVAHSRLAYGEELYFAQHANLYLSQKLTRFDCCRIENSVFKIITSLLSDRARCL
jgi:hypothetical protein